MRVASIGAINWDINLFVEHLPKPDEEVRVLNITRTPGGTAANVAVASARMLGPNEVAFLGALGNDDIGREQIRILKSEGVYTDAIKIVEGVESGQAYILIDRSGRNIINTFFGANLHVDKEYVNSPQVLNVLSKIRVLVVMDPPLEAAFEILRIYNGLKIWDPGVYVNEGFNSLKEGLLKTNIFILNEVEALSFFNSIDPSKIKDILSDINSRAKVIIKRGAKGSRVIDLEKCVYADIPALPMDKLGLRIVNTVGSGDAYIGALAAYLSINYELYEAIKYATCAGAYNATRPETRGSPTRDILESLYDRANRYLNIVEKSM